VLAALIALVAVLVLAVGISLMNAGPSRVRRRVVYVSSRPAATRTRVRRPDGPTRRRRTVVEDVVPAVEPEPVVETRRIVEYE
jgi:hypothetical protein